METLNDGRHVRMTGESMSKEELSPTSDVDCQGRISHFNPDEIPHALAQIARLTEGVKAEFDLIAGRMSWLVIAESFIFGAFAASVSSYRPDHTFSVELLYLIRVMPVVGMFLAACVYVAILAAHSALSSLKTQRDRMIEWLPSRLRIDLISTKSRIQLLGNVPTHVIPPVLFLVWAGAFALLLI
jgi:hypothetical protein